MRRPTRRMLIAPAAATLMPCVSVIAGAEAATQSTSRCSPPPPAPPHVLADVAFLTGCAAFLVFGVAIPRRQRQYLVALAILGGVPFGMWLDGISADGPSCGMIGVPLQFILFGYVGVLIRTIVAGLCRRKRK